MPRRIVAAAPDDSAAAVGRRFRPSQIAGFVGLVIFALMGLTSGLSGVISFVGLYIMLTGIYAVVRRSSWLGKSTRRVGVGVLAGGFVVMLAGGAVAGPSAVDKDPAVIPSSTQTPSRSVTPTPSPTTTPPIPTPTPTPEPASEPAPEPAVTSAAPVPAPVEPEPEPAVPVVPEPAPAAPVEPAPAPAVADPVHPGAFCSPSGATGFSAKGVPMVCTTTADDDRDRWRKA